MTGRSSPVTPYHNYPIARRANLLAANRRLAPKTADQVVRMHSSGTTPASIISTLRNDDPNTNVTRQAIYNAGSAAKRKDLSGRTNLEALFTMRESDDWVYRSRRDEDGHLNALFFTHSVALQWARTYPTSIISDCTYKTNRFKLPLFHVVRQSATFETYSIAFCFMTKEDDEGYIWAIRALVECVCSGFEIPTVISTDRERALMNAIATSSKGLLCRRHIFKNLAANLKRVVADDEKWSQLESEFWAVVEVDTEDAFSIK